jgi:hypothetical protein
MGGDYPISAEGPYLLYIYTDMAEDKNVLSVLPGEIIGAAMNTLPPAETCQEAFREVTIDDPSHGFTEVVPEFRTRA